MAVIALTNVRPVVDGIELTTVSNQATVNLSTADLDTTTFGSNGFRTAIAGLRTSTVDVNGYVDFSFAADAALWNKIGGTSSQLMILPTGGAVGEPALFGGQLAGTYGLNAQIGNLVGFTAHWNGDGPFQTGTVLTSGAVTATATGTAVQVSAVPTGYKLYAQAQCIAASGTLAATVAVKSAATSGFGSPTTRATFSAINAIGATSITPVAGSITDAWWRADITCTGTGSLTLLVAVGIAPA